MLFIYERLSTTSFANNAIRRAYIGAFERALMPEESPSASSCRAGSRASTFCVQLVKPEHVVEEFVGLNEK